MDTLGGLLKGIRDSSEVTGKEDACYFLKDGCLNRKTSCTDCVLDYRANLDKQIIILNKLEK